MVSQAEQLGTVPCCSCGRAVDNKHFVHLHDEDHERCDWLCLPCWVTVAAWAIVGALHGEAGECQDAR